MTSFDPDNRESLPEGKAETFELARLTLPEEQKECLNEARGMIAKVLSDLAPYITNDEAWRARLFWEIVDDSVPKIKEVRNRVLELFDYDFGELDQALEDFDVNGNANNFRRVLDAVVTLQKGIKSRLEAMGGDTRECLVKVLQRYDIDEDSAWHDKVLGKVEREGTRGALKLALERFDIPLSLVNITDRGMGTGRFQKMLIGVARDIATQMLMDANGITKLTPNQEKAIDSTIEKFAKNLYGMDLLPKNVERAQRILGSFGVPEENLVAGDFQSSPEKCDSRFASGNTHLSICMMRTVLYNVTEKQLRNFLKQLETDLVPGTPDRPGGIALFDTVGMHRRDLKAMRDPEARASLDDLKNFYSSLWRWNSFLNQRFMPEGVDLVELPRYPIFDNTTGQGFYWREVITGPYLQHVIDKYGLDLEIWATTIKTPGIKKRLRKFARNLGRKWIKDNDLETIYRQIIEDRISSGMVDPARILKKEIAEDDDVLEDCLNYVAFHMVRRFGAEYYLLQRLQKS
ncbi:hypothetical protein KJ742_02705 [Patescibacteria group bacterium]|nr:hypothetical protein [Patescibacteria group bacterium]MBU1682831.1 hypothetical protein [Patescibacteria group bacterium]MBU1935342.1 hypothetical protein [Patescibacteria group bacterium]